MTTHKNFLNSAPEVSSEQDKDLTSQLINSTKDSRDRTKWGGTLRRRLLMTVLPTTLVPLVVASAIEINITHNRAEEQRLDRVKQLAVLSREITNKFFKDTLKTSYQLAANPLVIEAVESGTQQVQSQGLLSKNIEQVEQQFASTKLLERNKTLNDYLKATAKIQDLAEIIVTEDNGFNVAYSSPTSDFVQSDEQWWQIGRTEGQKVLESTLDKSTNIEVVETVNSLQNPNTGKVFGVAKVSVSTKALDKILAESVGVKLSDSEILQIIDGKAGSVLDTVTNQRNSESKTIIGGESVAEAAKIFTQALSTGNLQNGLSRLQEVKGISNVELQESEDQTDVKILSFESQGKYFKVTSIPETSFLAVMSIDKAEIAEAGTDLMVIFALTASILGLLATGVIVLLARNLSKPLTNLADKAQQVAAGDLDVQAQLEGTEETVILGDNFNKLVQQVKVLIQAQEAIADEQRQQKESLEQGLYQLLDELQDALDGDLTVRASLTSMEMSTVADLFNAIIDSLSDIAFQVKQSSTQVSSSLEENEKSIQRLATQAIQETEETRKTLASVEQISHSIEEVSANANQAATLADNAYQETQAGAKAMGETVNSIVSLRTTIGETAKQMKRLGESSQKISQVVSLIEEIALKTNLLAINASVEASRAGEQGQGFTVVAEQVGALAEQSATATKEIAKIVAAIQTETQEVTQAMEVGTSQVIESTHLVESTKQSLGKVLERSRSINELMKLISQSTVSQTETSQVVKQLMEQIAEQSEQRLTSSEQIAQSMQATAQVAKQLESAVEQFKVNEE